MVRTGWLDQERSDFSTRSAKTSRLVSKTTSPSSVAKLTTCEKASTTATPSAISESSPLTRFTDAGPS